MPESIEYIIQPKSRYPFNWDELWRYRELFYFFTWRDIKIKYKQTILGFFWAILQPVLMMLILTLFFGRAMENPSLEISYTVYVFTGILIWNIFSSGLTNAANSMVSNGPIIKKIYFPRLIIPVSAILVALFDFMVSFIVFIPILLYYRQPVTWVALWSWPASICVSMIASLGLGCWLAALNVKYRDFRYVIPFLVQVLFFLTPVIYPASLLKDPLLQYILAVSPLYAAVELFRLPMMGSIYSMSLMMISLCSGLVLLLIGIIYFKATEDFFADFA